MRTVLSGAGLNTTSTVSSLLATSGKVLKKRLFLIGETWDPYAIWLTDSAKSLTWSLYGTFNSASVTCGDVKTSLGVNSPNSVTLKWYPKNRTFGNTVATASPQQLAANGYYDNWRFRAWTVYLPLTNDGDANTYGASELFAGIVGNVTVDREAISWEVPNLLQLLDQQLPLNVIGTANNQAQYSGSNQPPGETQGVPFFTVFTGSTPNVIYGDVEAPYTTGHIFNTTANGGAGVFAYGFLVFINSPGSTLAGFWSPVESNAKFVDGHSNNHNQFNLYNPMPWAPTPWTGSSGDQFYVSAKQPVTQADSTAAGTPYDGFPYVPDPSTQV